MLTQYHYIEYHKVSYNNVLYKSVVVNEHMMMIDMHDIYIVTFYRTELELASNVVTSQSVAGSKTLTILGG